MPIAEDSAGCVAGAEDQTDDADRWVDDHGDALFRFAMLRVSDATTAEDVVQETLLAAWRGRDGYDGRSSLRTWLVSILKARIADHFRRAGRDRLESAGVTEAEFDTHGSWSECPTAWRGRALRTALDACADAAAPDRRLEHAEFWDILSRCTSDLPGHLGRVLHSRTLADRPTDEVCEQEGISAKNLSVRLHRARLLLRRCLEQRWFRDDRSGS